MKVLIFGRARGVWDEIVSACALGKFDHVMAVGSVGIDYPHAIDSWVTFHFEQFPLWLVKRQNKGYPPAKLYWSSYFKSRGRQPTITPAVKFVTCEGGSSGLIGVMAALDELAATRVVLAGIPMDADFGQYDTKVPWKEAVKHRVAWEKSLPKLQEHVKSMSGWTASLLGTPTPDWLERC